MSEPEIPVQQGNKTVIFLCLLSVTLTALPWVYPLPKAGKIPVVSAGPQTTLRWVYTQMQQRKTKKQHQLLQLDPAVVLDLAAAGLKAGASIPQVLSSLDAALNNQQLNQVSKGLLIGLPWETAWQAFSNRANPPFWVTPLKEALEPAWKDGVSPESLLTGQSRQLRRQKDQRAKEAAQRLAVKLVLPLGLCQLPAFILLGIVPNVLAGIKIL